MKNLTVKEFEEAPSKIQLLYMCAHLKRPVGSELIESAIKEFPEYFEELIAHRKNWASIPQSVHEEYKKECRVVHDRIFKDLPKEGRGILYQIEHPEEASKYMNLYSQYQEEAIPFYREIHKKHYGKYKIDFNERTASFLF
jgi:hypothetical protein